MKKRGYLQISFAWLFAIIVGAVILFLAIYASTKLMSISQYELDTKTAKNLGILLNPLETSFETAKVTFFTLPIETRIYNKCEDYGDFGKQIIQISQKSFNKWPEPAEEISFSNKYIFSEREIEGKKFYVFSKPFDFPFKVSDLIYITSSKKEYCFINPPDDIGEEISYLNQKNLLLEDELKEEGKDCPENSIKICFGSGDCEIHVYGDRIEKNGEKLYFEGDALMYAAIFSDKDVYDCQLKRLMQRTKHLALIYQDKAEFIARTGCHSNLNLNLLRNYAEDFSDSNDLAFMISIVNDIKDKNEDANCKLF